MKLRPAGSFELRLSDAICDFIEAEYAAYKITNKERRDAYRRIRIYLGLSGLEPMDHIKKRIRYRLRRNGEYRETAPLPDAIVTKRRRVQPKTAQQHALELFLQSKQPTEKG